MYLRAKRKKLQRFGNKDKFSNRHFGKLFEKESKAKKKQKKGTGKENQNNEKIK